MERTPIFLYYSQELIRKDKRREASEANSAWVVAKLAVFKQPAWDQLDCSKIVHFWQQMAPFFYNFFLFGGALFKKKLVKNARVRSYLFLNLGLLMGSFDQKFHKDFRDIQILSVELKLTEL